MNSTIDGLTLYHELHGSGAPVLFVHGFPLSGKLWEPIVPLIRRDFRLIVPDLRGHGKSEASASVTMARYADDLAALLDEIGETAPVALVGMSMGGYVAFEFCRRHPERVRKLVLTNTRAQADPPEDATLRRDIAQRVLVAGSSVSRDAMMPKLFGPRASRELRERWWKILTATDPRGVAAALEAISRRPDSFETLAAMDRPILIVTGEHDAITPATDAEKMKEAAPHAAVEIIPGAGHMTPVEFPGRFASVLLRFLRD